MKDKVLGLSVSLKVLGGKAQLELGEFTWPTQAVPWLRTRIVTEGDAIHVSGPQPLPDDIARECLMMVLRASSPGETLSTSEDSQ